MKIKNFLNNNGEINKIALSNEVFELNDSFYKKYSVNEFKKIFRNQDIILHQNLNNTKFEVNFDIFEDGISTKKINGNKLDKNNIKTDQIKLLANSIIEFNNLKFNNVNEAGFFRAIDFFETLNYVKEIVNEEKEIIEKAKKNAFKQLRLCHNDLISDNIFFEKEQIKFIDFEYSGMINYHFDLAIVLNSWLFSEEQEKIFLDEYLKTQEIDWEYLKIVRKFLIIFWCKLCYFKFNETKKEVYNYLLDMISKRYDQI